MSQEFRSGPIPGWYAFLVLGAFFLGPFAIMLNFSFYYKIPGVLYEPAFVLDNYGRLLPPFFGVHPAHVYRIVRIVFPSRVVIEFALTWSIANMSKTGRTFWLIFLGSLLSLSEVVTGTAPQYIPPIPLHPPEPVPPQRTIRLPVTDHRLHRLPTLETLLPPPGHHAPPLPGPIHRSHALAMPPVARSIVPSGTESGPALASGVVRHRDSLPMPSHSGGSGSGGRSPGSP